MANKDFEEQVLKSLKNLTEDVSGLKEDISWLKVKMDSQTIELKQSINLQGAYVNQAFEHITRMQTNQYMQQNQKG